MRIFVNTITGESWPIDVDPTDEIARVKVKVQQASGIPPNQQRLIFPHPGGPILVDTATVASCGILHQNIVTLLLHLRGGGHCSVVPGDALFPMVISWVDMHGDTCTGLQDALGDVFFQQLDNEIRCSRLLVGSVKFQGSDGAFIGDYSLDNRPPISVENLDTGVVKEVNVDHRAFGNGNIVPLLWEMIGAAFGLGPNPQEHHDLKMKLQDVPNAPPNRFVAIVRGQDILTELSGTRNFVISAKPGHVPSSTTTTTTTTTTGKKNVDTTEETGKQLEGLGLGSQGSDKKESGGDVNPPPKGGAGEGTLEE